LTFKFSKINSLFWIRSKCPLNGSKISYLSSTCEAGKRTIFWTYTPAGKIKSKIKPDGTTLHYSYNSQGELSRVNSREFKYDKLGRLIEGSGFQRELDPFGNIIKEKMDTGLILKSTYDDWNRPTERILPDHSKIQYKYEGPFLKIVTRVNRDGKILYSHYYEKFNEIGCPLTERGIFTTSYDYDKSGRRICFSKKTF